ncbi:MAG: hypothetical protein ACXABG_14565, partial [Promethearchaeota archaeon]
MRGGRISLQTRELISPNKVIVIDNKFDEVSLLIRALWSYRIPVIYYNGKKRELPSTPISGIRLIFLDMELDGMQGQTVESKCSTLMNVLRSVVSMENGPYIIFAWTQYEDLLGALRQNLEIRGKDVPRPYFIDNMEKSECLEGGAATYEFIVEKLEEKLGNLPIFEYFFKWEHLVTSKVPDVIQLLCSKAKSTTIQEWRRDMTNILCQIAVSNSGDSTRRKRISLTQSSMRVLNSILEDYLEKEVSKVQPEVITCPTTLSISEMTKADLNTRVHIRNL